MTNFIQFLRGIILPENNFACFLKHGGVDNHRVTADSVKTMNRRN